MVKKNVEHCCKKSCMKSHVVHFTTQVQTYPAGLSEVQTHKIDKNKTLH